MIVDHPPRKSPPALGLTWCASLAWYRPAETKAAEKL